MLGFYWPPERLGPYITADLIYGEYNKICEETLKKLDISLSRDVKALAREASAAIEEMTEVDRCQEAAKLARQFFEVGNSLITGQDPGEDADRIVAEEVDLALRADRVEKSPLFGYSIDYTQFRPRGYYTETKRLRQFFRAMSWYGIVAFRLCSDLETRAAMLIARAFARDAELIALWNRVDYVYTQLLSECDDVTPVEYARLVNSSADEHADEEEQIQAFREQAEELRTPKIKPWPIPEGCGMDLNDGMRFFSKRYLVDSEVFRHLTHPHIEDRYFPTGLDLMVANGSERARELVEAWGHATMKGYAEGAGKARSAMEEFKNGESPSYYADVLKLAESLTSSLDPRAPAFARTDAYSDKNLASALGVWILAQDNDKLFVVKRDIDISRETTSLGAIEGKELMPGYVEPNPEFFKRLQKLTLRFSNITKPYVKPNLQLRMFASMVDTLGGIVDRELSGEPFTDRQVALLDNFSSVLGTLHSMPTQMPNKILRSRYSMALATDVHTVRNGLADPVISLQEAVGRAMPIFVAVQNAGQWQLFKGGVYTYYEVQRALQDGLTHEEWCEHSRWTDYEPVWTASYMQPLEDEVTIASYGNREHIRRLRKEDEHTKLAEFAAVPDLSDYVMRGDLKSDLPGVAELLAKAGPEGLPALKRLAQSKRLALALPAIEAASRMPGEAGTEVLLAAAHGSQNWYVRYRATVHLVPTLSENTEEVLTRLWPALDTKARRLFFRRCLNEWGRVRNVGLIAFINGKIGKLSLKNERRNQREHLLDRLLPAVTHRGNEILPSLIQLVRHLKQLPDKDKMGQTQ